MSDSKMFALKEEFTHPAAFVQINGFMKWYDARSDADDAYEIIYYYVNK